MNFSQDICSYTAKGCEKIHSNLKTTLMEKLSYVINNLNSKESIEYNDNKISRYLAQYGKCHVLGIEIELYRVYCHRKIPLELGGTNKYSNLIIVDIDVHNIITETHESAIRNLLKTLNLNIEQLEKINLLRKLAGNQKLTYKFT